MGSRSTSRSKRASTRVIAAVLMLSAAGLIFELTLTRLFLATVWYHYAFIAISLAVFGWSFGGFIAYLLQKTRRGRSMQPVLVGACLAMAMCLPLFFWIAIKYPIAPSLLNVYFAIGLLPFIAGGAAMAQAIETYGGDTNRLYLAGAAGAVLGILLMPVLISNLGLAAAVLATAALPALAGVVLSVGPMAINRKVWSLLAIIVLAGTTDLIMWHCRTQGLTLRNAPNKALHKLLRSRPQAKIDNDRWNSYSRITTVIDSDDYRLARLFIDSDAEMSILRWDGTQEGIPNARDWFRAFPYRLADQPRVLILGAGSGTDAILALCIGSPQVTALETNPLIIDAVRRWGGEVGYLYDHRNMRLITEEARIFIAQSNELFDTIVLGLRESQSSVSSGGMSLVENYLYTVNAMEKYYDHLSDRGALAIIREPSDMPRLVANAVAFLSRRGMKVDEIGRHLLVVSQSAPNSPATSASEESDSESLETIFLLSKKPLEEEAVGRLLEGHTGAYVFWGSSRSQEPLYRDLFEGRMTPDAFGQSCSTLATPVSDNRPFHFAMSKPHGLPKFAINLVWLPIICVFGFSILLLAGSRAIGFQVPGPRAIIYFGSLGMGFIAFEIALIQQLVLLLGGSISTIIVILFTLLLSGIMGNLISQQLPRDAIRRKLGGVIPVIICVLVVAAFLLSPLSHVVLYMPFIVRLISVVIITFPLGILMGMPHPLGLRQVLRRFDNVPASALCGISGVAGVIGAVGAALLAVMAGFAAVFLAAAACYMMAWATRPK